MGMPEVVKATGLVQNLKGISFFMSLSAPPQKDTAITLWKGLHARCTDLSNNQLNAIQLAVAQPAYVSRFVMCTICLVAQSYA